MDNVQEQQCLQVIAQELRKGSKTLIVYTHKMVLLNLVDRIIIMANNQIVMDGPKQAVLAQLQKNEEKARLKALEHQREEEQLRDRSQVLQEKRLNR